MRLLPDELDVDEIADQTTAAIDARREQFREEWGMAGWLADVIDVATVLLGAFLVSWSNWPSVLAVVGVGLVAVGLSSILGRVIG